jgi:hypothetical protein
MEPGRDVENETVGFFQVISGNHFVYVGDDSYGVGQVVIG